MNATFSIGPPISRGFGKWLRISLVIHVVTLGGVFFLPSAREFFTYTIIPPATKKPKEISLIPSNSPAELQKHLDQILALLLKNPNSEDLMQRVKEGGDALLKSSQDSEQKFYDAQIEDLATKLGINVSEAKKLLPPMGRSLPDFEKLFEKIQQGVRQESATLHETVEALSKASAQIAIEAEGKQQMALNAAQGETSLHNLSIADEDDTRKTIRRMLEGVAADHSKGARDLTEAMRSYYGAELAQGGTPRSFRAGLDDATPGRVQVTQTGLIPPPLLDKKWLASVYRGQNIASFPAGRISQNTNPTRWGPLFLDSWYILGPWALDKEQDFFKSFPPESRVDLDAEYIGKGGRKLRWQFIQSKEPLVDLPLQIPDSTTYAFTTLEIDQELAVWILCGADDRMKLWINGIPIFGSLSSLKGWHIGNEGIRKVLFRAGRNDVLVRIDNLPGFTRFSVVLLPDGSETKIFRSK